MLRADSIDNDIPDREREYPPGGFVDSRESPSEALERTELREILAKALKSLSETVREAVVLRDAQKLSIAKTAEILGVRKGAVKSRLLRARLRLRPLVGAFTTARGLFNPDPSQIFKRRQWSANGMVPNRVGWHTQSGG
jgi:RNA polymerase sigma-70 factor (ECF subfamily)